MSGSYTRGAYVNHAFKQKSDEIAVIATRGLFLLKKPHLLGPNVSLGFRHSVFGKECLWYSNGAVNTTSDKRYGLFALLMATIAGTVFGALTPFFLGIVEFSKPADVSVADVVEHVSPAVVFIEIKGMMPTMRTADGEVDGRIPRSDKQITLSNGSGLVVRENGIILTNAHVVANVNKSKVEVTLQDGRVFEGQVIAVDPICDLAAIKIEADDLDIITLADSSELRAGDYVIALGSPLSLTKTVTGGIVSNVERQSGELGLRNKNMEYVQTDAVINFGNSGGPLVNMNGHCVGVNSMKITTGISFAIPSSYARKFLTKAETLVENGQTENGFAKRRYMGVTMLTLTKNLIRDQLKTFNIDINTDANDDQTTINGGVLIYSLIPGTPAHQSGMLARDIIIEINGQVILSAADVYDIVEKSENLIVKVLRNGRQKTIELNTNEAF